MALLRLALVLALTGGLCSRVVIGGETITVDGKTYANAEMVDVAPSGAAYKTEDGEVVILPWAELRANQLTAIKAKFPEAIRNAKYEAYYVKGSIFHIAKDGGHIVQISLGDEEIPYDFTEGAVVPKSGLVFIRDLPTSVPQFLRPSVPTSRSSLTSARPTRSTLASRRKKFLTSLWQDRCGGWSRSGSIPMGRKCMPVSSR